MIDSFEGENRWLSNFWESPIVDKQGNTWPSVEHAYQAMKSTDKKVRETIRLLPSPYAAKKAGKAVTLRADWEQKKLEIMDKLVRAKFDQNPELKAKLVATGTQELVEGNTWGDVFWGVYKGKGENHLGKILMALRLEYLNKPYIIAGTGSRSLVLDPLHMRIVIEKLKKRLIELKDDQGNVLVISGMAEGFDEALAIAAVETKTPWRAALPNPSYIDYYWGTTSLLKRNRSGEGLVLLNLATERIHVCNSHIGVKHKRPGGANFDRNEYMVDNADEVWCYDASSVGTKQCHAYALKQRKPIIMITLDDS